MDLQKTREILDSLYESFDFKERLQKDPIRFVYQYSRAEDQEIVAFLASSFAYGRVELFSRVIEAILDRMGPSPWTFLQDFEPPEKAGLFKGIYYRLSKDGDILRFLGGIARVIKKYRTLENLFRQIYNGDLFETEKAFLEEIKKQSLDISKIEGFTYTVRGLNHLLPSLSGGSPAKRLNLFLRWMVRRADIDLGLWSVLKPSELIIPLDTHIARLSRCLGLTKKSTISWAMAEEITSTLRRFDPQDPLKYDFALCHQGIKGHCINLCEGKIECPISARNTS